MIDVLVVAGTSESRDIIARLLKIGLRVIATVVTDYGADLLKLDHASENGLIIYTGALGKEDIVRLIKEQHVRIILDASHPYAINATKNFEEAAAISEIKYIRFEREEIEITDHIIRVTSFLEAAQAAEKIEGNILLTIGSRNLSVFTENISDFQNRIYSRILPDFDSIKVCKESGLNSKNILALEGPFTKEFNLAMINHTKAKVLVTKDSGAAGGTREKIAAATEAGILTILIERPAKTLNYVKNLDEAVSVVVEELNDLS